MTTPEDKPLIEYVDEVFRGTDYNNPDEFGGDSLIGIRIRYKEKVDPETEVSWVLSDKLLTYVDENEPEASRGVALVRGDMKEQIILNLDIDSDTISVAGLGAFTGDAREEFLAGLRIIED